MANTHPELVDAQDHFGRIKDSLRQRLENRDQLRAELSQVRDGLLELEDRIRGPGFPDFIDRYEATRRRFDELKEEYHDNQEILHRFEAAMERAKDEIRELESRSQRKEGPSRPSTTTHRYFYSYASGPASSKPSHRGRSEKHKHSGHRHHSREAKPDFHSSREGKRGPTTHHYHYGPPPFSHQGSDSDSPHSSRYEDSGRGYYTREARPDYASSSRRPSTPRESHSRYEQHRRDERPHYSDREHPSHSRHDSFPRDRQPPPPESGPSRGPSLNFPPSAQTIASWRKCVDDCFADYSKIKEFPHPPVPKDENWEHNLKVLLLCLDNYDLKKERLRWHPDKFSACAADKQEEWKRLAKEVFVVMNEARKEKEREE